MKEFVLETYCQATRKTIRKYIWMVINDIAKLDKVSMKTKMVLQKKVDQLIIFILLL